MDECAGEPPAGPWPSTPPGWPAGPARSPSAWTSTAPSPRSSRTRRRPGRWPGSSSCWGRWPTGTRPWPSSPAGRPPTWPATPPPPGSATWACTGWRRSSTAASRSTGAWPRPGRRWRPPPATWPPTRRWPPAAPTWRTSATRSPSTPAGSPTPTAGRTRSARPPPGSPPATTWRSCPGGWCGSCAPQVRSDKGDAVRRVAAESGATALVVVGDDLGDLPAFAAAAELGGGLRVAVRSAEAPPELLDAADLVVDGPEGVRETCSSTCSPVASVAAVRIESSVTAVSWVPLDCVEGGQRLQFHVGAAQYDDPPPDHLDDLPSLLAAGRVRLANRLRGFVEVDGGRIVASGQSGQGHVGAPRVGSGSGRGRRSPPLVGFAAVALPDLRPDPEVGDGWVRFGQTAGGLLSVGMPYQPDPGLAAAGRPGRLDHPVADHPRRRDQRAGPGRGQPVPAALGLRPRRAPDRHLRGGRLHRLAGRRLGPVHPLGRPRRPGAGHRRRDRPGTGAVPGHARLGAPLAAPAQGRHPGLPGRPRPRALPALRRAAGGGDRRRHRDRARPGGGGGGGGAAGRRPAHRHPAGRHPPAGSRPCPATGSTGPPWPSWPAPAAGGPNPGTRRPGPPGGDEPA